MNRALALAAAALLAAPAAASDDQRAVELPRLGGDAGAEGARRALRLLGDEDVEGARAVVEPLLARDASSRPVQLAAGVLAFYEHRSDEAVSLLDAAGGGHEAGGYLALARATREVTKDHALSESEHFAVSYPKGKDEVLVPYLTQALEAQRAALAGDLGGEPPAGKVRVEVLNGVRELARLSTLSEQEIRTSGTIAICKFDKLMIVSPKALLHGYDWLDTAAHEYTHYVVTRRTRNRTPIWLHEGIAKWSETRWRGPGGESFSPFSAALLKDALARNDLVTFEQMHPSMAKLPSQERAALAFAEVVLAVEYLVKKGGPPLVSRVLDLVAEGRPADAAVAEALAVPFDRFLADWKRYMAARPLPRGGERELARLRFKDDPKQGGDWSEWAEIPDARARGFARLGELMRERGKWTAARIEYGKAVSRVGTRYAILSDQYALAAMMSGGEDDAERTLADALGWNPDSAALHVHLARLLVKRKEFPRAREHLLLANRQDPFDPEIHAGLALSLEALGDAGGASRERRFAEILAHGRHD